MLITAIVIALFLPITSGNVFKPAELSPSTSAISFINSRTSVNPKASIASEVAAIVSDKAFDYLDAPVKRVTAPHTPVPYSKELENEFMPDSDDVLQTVKNILDI